MKSAIQLYSVRGVDASTAELIERSADAGYDGVELFELDEIEPIQESLSQTGLDVAGSHVGLEELESNPDEVLTAHSALDCGNLVVPWVEPEHFESISAVEALADRLSAVAEDLPSWASLHYHNHDQELASIDGKLAIERLLDRADTVQFEIDLGWVGLAGRDPVEVLERNAERISLIHVKDYDPESGAAVDLGEGRLDVEACIQIARENDVQWLIFEHESDPDTFETARRGAAALEPYTE